MNVLALDTATPAPSLAVLRDDHVAVDRVVSADGAGRRVGQEIHRALGDGGLRVHDLDTIVVGVGPGGFTGLRIGMATALAMAQALAIDVVGVCSLETLAVGMAQATGGDALLVPVIDAKRREVFTGVYRAGPTTFEVVHEPAALTVDAFAELLAAIAGTPAVVAGDGVARVAAACGPEVTLLPDGPAHQVRALHAVQRWRAGGGRPVAPMYLRLPDAEVNRLLRESGEK